MAGSLNVSPATAQLELQSELMSGESLLWAGQPLRKVVFHRTDWFAIPFSILWAGFALFWEDGVSGHFDNAQAPNGHPFINFMMLWGIPFVLIGQYFVWGRFIYMAWAKTRTFYGLTNKRVLVLRTGRSRKLLAGYLHSLTSVSLTTRSDGIGTIEFAPEPTGQSMWGMNGRASRGGFPMDIDLSRLAFFDIESANNIYRLIQEQRERLQASN